MINIKKRSFILSIVILILLSIIVGAVTHDININNTNQNKTNTLSKVFNEDVIDFDKQFRDEYLKQRNNFSNLNFKRIIDKEDFILKVGARNDKLRGIEINQSRFVVDLISCNPHERYCAFRVNGVPTKKLFSVKDFGNNKTATFELDRNYILKINSISFDFCDNRRFCHLGADGYHVVDVSVERKG